MRKTDFVFLPLLLILFVCTGVRAQSNIPVSYPVDFITQFQDIYVDGPGVGYAVGTCGVLRKSTDGGQMWSTVSSPTDENIESVACPPSGCATALLVDDNGFYRLQNGTWTAINYPDFSGSGEIHWLTENIVIHDQRGKAYDRSTDGGRTWTKLELANNPNCEMAFPAPNTVVVFIDRKLYKSTDNGATFVAGSFEHTAAVREQTWLDANIGWFYDGDGLFYKTTNGGTAWTLLNATRQLTSVNWMVALSATHLVGAQVTTFRLESTDGGVTWTRGNFLADGNERINEKYHRRGNEFFTVGNQSQLLYSPANFENFEEIDPYGRQARIDKIAFASNTVGYAISSGLLKVTTDAGVNWLDRPLGQSGRDLAVLSNGNVVVMGSSQPIISTNQGASFTNWLPNGVMVANEQPTVFARKPNGDIYLMSSNYGYATTNEGQSFTAFNHALGFQASAVFFLNSNEGFAVGNQSQYATTSNGGQTWTAGTGPGNNCVDVYFTSPTSGWVSTASSRWVTTDAGQTWTPENARGGYDFTLRPADGSILANRFASGNNGEVARSRDNGATWDVIAYSCFSYRSGAITPDGKYWFSGGDGFMVRHDLEALLTGTRRVEAAAAVHLRAFPNPTNGDFTLELPQASTSTSLEIYDGSGRFIRRETVAPGRERINLSLADMPAGVYLVRWVAGGMLGRVRVIKG